MMLYILHDSSFHLALFGRLILELMCMYRGPKSASIYAENAFIFTKYRYEQNEQNLHKKHSQYNTAPRYEVCMYRAITQNTESACMLIAHKLSPMGY